jgi:tripartite-type tricarboxylate transporter receptor subunit TctC
MAGAHGRGRHRAVELTMRRRALLLAAPAVVSQTVVARAASAQTTLPDKGLRIIVGFVNNGGADLMARSIAPALERRVGRRVTVENRPGNTGQAAGEALQNSSAKDGSVIAFMPSTTIALRAATASFPFDPEKDLAAITSAGTFQTALAVSPQIGASTLDAYIAWAKDGEAERRRVGVVATDALLRVYVRTVGHAIDVPLEGVGYRGALPLVSDLASGKLAAGMGGVTSFLEHHRGGRLRMLAVSGDRHFATAREVPTARELGRPDMLSPEWYGFFASVAAPPAIVTEWNRQICAVLADKEVAATLAQYGLEVEGSTPEEASARVKAHLESWRIRMAAFKLKPSN